MGDAKPLSDHVAWKTGDILECHTTIPQHKLPNALFAGIVIELTGWACASLRGCYDGPCI